MGHTPGPWKVADRFYVWTDDDVGCEVAKVCDENLDEDMLGQADADARLIAAAPDMLNALQLADNALDYAQAQVDSERDAAALRSWRRDVQRAIALATGTPETTVRQ